MDRRYLATSQTQSDAILLPPLSLHSESCNRDDEGLRSGNIDPATSRKNANDL